MLKSFSNKEKKLLLKQLQDQFDFSGKLDYSLFINQDKKIFIFNKDAEINFSKIKANSLGLYFANLKNELRLTIEGSQIIGPYSKKNILEVNEDQLQDWIHGRDMETDKKFEGFVLIRNKNDFYGTGRYKEGKMLNFVPKERRLKN